VAAAGGESEASNIALMLSMALQKNLCEGGGDGEIDMKFEG
jgi:hypothetical protein